MKQTPWYVLLESTAMASIVYHNDMPVLLENDGHGRIYASIYRKNRWSVIGIAWGNEEGWHAWPYPKVKWVMVDTEQEAINHLLEEDNGRH